MRCSRSLRDAEDHLERAQSLRGEEREMVIADLESERRRLADAWARLDGPAPRRSDGAGARRS